ncbi:mechanosensitive ion channel family protein [Psychrobacter phenylpyruvicus]|uniref:Potassium efflux system KefA n=1 Tax=Psychrobacter phenylpyruvicus TaxID=29432 RepID=A0A379LJB4_9GAMM|nr:mechanosensitive ion channel domain-containing protein [Psychrobacter phenylpyruvicus]SUD90710.1 Potassium efflux system KefA precursor [Psychrobacter phenylpyruvicus]
MNNFLAYKNKEARTSCLTRSESLSRPVTGPSALQSSVIYQPAITKWGKHLLRVLHLAVVLLFVFFASVSAQANASVENTQTTQQSQDIEQADNIIDYAIQKVKQDKPEAEDEKQEVTRPLLADNELTGEFNEAYYKLNKLNSGLPELPTSPNLETPLATLEFFNSAVMQENFALAAYALNLNLLPEAAQKNQATDLVKKLDYLMTEKGLYVFDDLPDRADGLIEPALGTDSPIHGVARRSIKLGNIKYKDRVVPLYLERVRVGGQAPVWVFSAQTVGNINALYDIHKPAEFERFLPQPMKAKIWGISVWEVLILILFMFATLGISFTLSKGVTKLVSLYSNVITRRTESDELSLGSKGLTDFFSKITVPLTVTLSFSMMFALVSGSLPRVDAIATSTRPIIWLCLVISGLWLGIRAINFFANRYQDYQIDSLTEEEFNTQRIRMTYVSIFRRIFIFVMVLGGIWIGLAEFTDLEGLGTTLLTSAGIAGAIIGIAAQPTLGNIIAGFQVAITQPVRIGDTIFVEDIWCEVEDLRYTYAVLKTWDDRRLIVPMKHFVTEILENWSHTTGQQSTAVYLYVDYGADIEAIQNKFFELALAHELWDEDFKPEMMVTEVNKDGITLRGKVSSDSPLNAWYLECDIRKQMLDYLNENHRGYLPTDRITFAPRS